MAPPCRKLFAGQYFCRLVLATAVVFVATLTLTILSDGLATFFLVPIVFISGLLLVILPCIKCCYDMDQLSHTDDAVRVMSSSHSTGDAQLDRYISQHCSPAVMGAVGESRNPNGGLHPLTVAVIANINSTTPITNMLYEVRSEEDAREAARSAANPPQVVVLDGRVNFIGVGSGRSGSGGGGGSGAARSHPVSDAPPPFEEAPPSYESLFVDAIKPVK